MTTRQAVLCALVLAGCTTSFGQDTLPPLKDGRAPQTYEEAWAGFDPRAEPLDVEVLKAWEEDGMEMQVLRYRVGAFKGQKAMMGAVYGYPKGGTNLPGLVQVHGGGQYADYRAVLTNARRGYATISIAWAGRIAAPGYHVNRDGVKLFFASATNDPNYRLTTDWGALDGYHAPSRFPGTQSSKTEPKAWTLDAVESARNSCWFLWTLGARRALTFLEQQPEVDPERLGVYGHSMGGKITVLTAGADDRVRAAAPSCGGVSGGASHSAISDQASLRRMACPIVFLSPANDFHGRINDLQQAVKDIRSKDWRVTCAPHHNHQDTAPYEVATQLWFDQHLKGDFEWPQTPESRLELKNGRGVPTLEVKPDAARPILSVDVYYTQQGQLDGEEYDRENTKTRFWRHAEAAQEGDTWAAQLPLFSTDEPLWVYANIAYPLEKPATGAGYYYSTYTADHFNLSSLMPMAIPEQLKAAGVRATLEPSLMIESFEGDWEKEWFTYKPGEGARSTHKIHDGQYAAPPEAKLALDLRSETPETVLVEMDKHTAEIRVAGDGEWQQVTLSPADFLSENGPSLADWGGIRQLTLGPKRKDDATPEVRNLRWVVSR